MTLADSRVGGS